jgi:3-deoxy-manno-octulosonate cytidylyltransferase (CMP-KDO synthetase)
VTEFFVAIPARYASTRLPGKPLLPLAGEPMIRHVVRRALSAGAKQVAVATDDQRIASALTASGATVVMTSTEHASGSDRLAECAAILGWRDDVIVVNLQGDEPLAPPSGIRAVAELLAKSGASMATLATPIADAPELFNPNCVKVVRGNDDSALYFSRAPVPWPRDAFALLGSDAGAASWAQLPPSVEFLRHIGIYAYRAGFLRKFAELPRTPLEQTESLEQLRALEHGHRIAVGIAPEPFPPGVDTPADFEHVEALLATR